MKIVYEKSTAAAHQKRTEQDQTTIRLLQPITGEEIALTSHLPAELNALLNQ